MSSAHHGVDVSWLHHNNANKGARTMYPRTLRPSTDLWNFIDLLKTKKANLNPQQPISSTTPIETPRNVDREAISLPETSDETSSAIPSSVPTKSPSKRGLLHRASSEKLTPATPGGSDEVKSSRRPGWMTNLSSKFSSSQANTPTLSSSPSQTSTQRQPQPGSHQAQIPKEGPATAVTDGVEEAEDTAPYVPQQPKSSGFLSSALRRFSSSSQQARPGQAALQGSTCPRRVLNLDTGRERTSVTELDQTRLRRVAFSVDVEVVGVSRYAESEEAVHPTIQAKDKKIQARGEGEALKNPRAFEQKGTQSNQDVNLAVPPDSADSIDDIFEGELLAAAKRQEQEAARQRRNERKEKKRKDADSSNAADQASATSTSPEFLGDSKLAVPIDSKGAHKSPDRPTTDPLRMYRRCCQLREAPVLKRISEQLARTKSEVERTGIVENLDLNNSRLQLPDIVCLGDWLAIVPVRRLLLDNANLGDESVRIVLAGLLAVKPPEMIKRKRARSNPNRLEQNPIQRTPGVIEKLSLRLNSKITSEGWRHICLFINLSRSLKSVDLAMTPFPAPQSEVMAQGARHSPDEPLSNPGDVAHVLSEALSKRSPSSRLEEFILSQCGLNTYTVGKVIDGIRGSNIYRLGIASNHLDHEALAHVARYIESGSCRGLDLGGNDLREATGIITTVMTSRTPLMALSLADCNLDPSSLARLMPQLLHLPGFRLLNLSHNRELFSSTPNAVATLRRYLPQLRALRRIELSDTAMQAEHAIAIAEVLPDVRNINHIGLLDNPELSKLSSTADPDMQPDSCAYYASLMWAVRLSKTLLAIDINLPTGDTNEVIQALGKQIDAYLFRNIDRYTSVNALSAEDPYSVIPDKVDPAKEVAIPDVLVHLVGHENDSITDVPSDTTTGPDQDYIVGGQGLAKALDSFLDQKSADLRRPSGQVTPFQDSAQQEVGKAKARNLAKGMLGSARKIQSRIELAMETEEHGGDDLMMRKWCLMQMGLQTLTLV